jgi:hypothetical protein
VPEQVLILASHVPHPQQVAILSVILAAIVIAASVRSRRFVLGPILTAVFLVLGLAPLYVCHLLQSRGVYHVKVELHRSDGSPIYYAQLKSSIPGWLQIFEGGWRLDVTQENRPIDGHIAFAAAAKDEFLKGSSTLTLADDYYPTVRILLTPDTSANIRGVVVDEGMVAVSGVTVSVVGYPETTLTDEKGKFVLPAHAGNGQMIQLRAQKNGVWAHLNAPAGKTAEVILDADAE